METTRYKDPRSGRFISAADYDLMVSQKKEISEKIDALVPVTPAEEVSVAFNDQVKKLIFAISDYLGITPDEFSQRIKITHPTPQDPVLMVDGQPFISWV